MNPKRFSGNLTYSQHIVIIVATAAVSLGSVYWVNLRHVSRANMHMSKNILAMVF